ncbi:hypothetical protein ABKA04_009247 [Annulohypoxylon sp. FPYF3050]
MTGHADTEELTEEVRETITHHNRTYQRISIDRKIYFVPVDEDETIRLRIQHDVLNMVFDGRSIFPPMGALRRVLDCGFGTGLWAFQVNGIDVSPHHYNPEESVENLYLNVDNLNMPLQFPPNNFDLVNSRLVAGGIDRNRWNGYLRDILRCLRGGGWCQMAEMDFNAQSDNGTLTDGKPKATSDAYTIELTTSFLIGHALRQWSDKYRAATAQFKNPDAPRRLGHWMRHAGFTDVEERNQRDFDIGVANQENIRLLLGSLALYPFTELLGMTITEFHVLVAQARAEASTPALKVRLYYNP